MDVDQDLIRHVASLAQLELSDDEVRAMAPQLARILEHVARVQAIELDDTDHAQAEAVLAPVELEALRDDEPGTPLEVHALMRQAPASDGSFFVVPAVFEGDGGDSAGGDS